MFGEVDLGERSIGAQFPDLTHLTQFGPPRFDLDGLPSSLRHLTLTQAGLTSVPEPLRSYQLESLNVSRNRISELPPWISEMSFLKELWLNDNLLEALPSGVGALKDLNVLSVTGNPMSELPRQVLDLSPECQVHVEGRAVPTGRATVAELNGYADLTVVRAPEACCKELTDLSHSVAVTWSPKFREWAIETRSSSSTALQRIHFCPWCGLRLPASLRDELWSHLDALGLDPGDSAVPPLFLDGTWWTGVVTKDRQRSRRPDEVT